MNEKEIKVSKALLRLFKIDGKPADELATLGQIEIFFSIISKKWNRLHIETSTQYGKSLFIALACVVLACIEGETIAIVAPTNDKAKIIMRYFIQHLGDHSLFHSQLEKDTSFEKLQMETTKDRIVLKNKGGIFMISVQAGNSKKGFESAMGEGAKICIQDESALIPDEIEATIFRMIAGKPDAVYIKVGNPFYRNHFYLSSIDERYHKIFINYEQGIKEGRYTEAFIEEARRKPYFSVLFENEFPSEDTMDKEGWTRLFTDELLQRVQKGEVKEYGERRLGCDIAEGGGDYNALVLRTANVGRKIDKFLSPDTMATVGLILNKSRELDVLDQNIFIDRLGVGKGVVDRAKEQNFNVYPVAFSERASDDSQFANQRAECYWNASKWLNEGGTLEPNDDWEQLSWIKYKVDSRGRILIISKDDLRKLGYPSPDVADAFVETFARKNVMNKSREDIRKERELLKQFDSHQKKGGIGLTGSPYLR